MKHLLHGTELAAFAALLLCVFYTDEYEPFLYKGGMLLISITAAVLVACLCHPSSFWDMFFHGSRFAGSERDHTESIFGITRLSY